MWKMEAKMENLRDGSIRRMQLDIANWNGGRAHELRNVGDLRKCQRRNTPLEPAKGKQPCQPFSWPIGLHAELLT